MNKQNFLTRMLLLLALIVGSVNGAWADNYEKVTSTAGITDGNYLIVYETGSVAFNGGLATLDATSNTISVTINDSKIVSNATTDAAAFTIDVTNGTIQSASGKYIGVSSNSNGLKQTEEASTYTHTFSIDASGNAVIAAVFDKSTMTLRYNKSSDQTRFRYYKNNGQSDIQLYKLISSVPSSNLSFTEKSPEISFPTVKTYSQIPTTATGYSGTITYEMTSNTAGATINTTTGEITVTKAGKVSVKATAAAVPGSFSDSNDSYTLTVNDERPASGIAWSSSEEVLIKKNAGSYDLPTLENPNSVDVSYEITGTAGLASESAGVITVDTSIEGTATITANYVGDDYKPCSVSYNITVYDPTVKGTRTNPYTVADVIAINPSKTSGSDYPSVYVKGYIVGVAETSSGTTQGSLIDGVSSYVNTNIAIADDPTNTTDYCLVQLEKGDIRTALNVKDHPYIIGVAQVLVKGDILKYCNKPGVRNLTEGSKVAEMVKITSAGLATYVSDDALDYSGKSISAYIAKEEGGKIKMYQVNKVPAGTGVLLKANGAAKVNIPITTEITTDDTDNVKDNLFKRGNGEAVSSGTTPSFNYILNDIGGTVGFYRANKQTVARNRAYLQTTIDAPANGRLSIFFDDEAGEATGITEVKDVKAADAIFNLNGVRVKNMTKGLYIVNGKKMIVK